MARKYRGRAGRTDIVTYGWHIPDGPGYSKQSIFDETAVEKILDAARARGVVGQFDTGRGAIVWFQGPPGKALRRVRDAVRALLPTDGVEPWPPRKK